MGLPRVLVAGMVLMGVWLAGTAGQRVVCEPSCPEYCTPGEQVSDPRDCTKYYTCLDDCKPSDVSFDCPEGQKFDNATRVCMVDDGYLLCDYCLPRCKYVCDGTNELAAVRGDCESVLICAEAPVQVSCGAGLYFNGTTCQDDPDQCCDDCEVFCEAPFTEVPDPTDCGFFYYCEQVGYPLPDNRFPCPDGEVFLDGHCRADGTCVPLCTGGSTDPTIIPSSSSSDTLFFDDYVE